MDHCTNCVVLRHAIAFLSLLSLHFSFSCCCTSLTHFSHVALMPLFSHYIDEGSLSRVAIFLTSCRCTSLGILISDHLIFLSTLFRVVTSHCRTLWSHCRTLHWVAALSRTALPHSVTSLHHSLLHRVATLTRAVFRRTSLLQCIAALSRALRQGNSRIFIIAESTLDR